jgi:hypothetical protein
MIDGDRWFIPPSPCFLQLVDRRCGLLQDNAAKALLCKLFSNIQQWCGGVASVMAGRPRRHRQCAA